MTRVCAAIWCVASSACPGWGEAAFLQVRQHGADTRMDSVFLAVDAQLAVDRGELIFNGLLGENESFGDGGVGQALGDEADDVALARGEFVDAGAAFRVHAGDDLRV